MVKVMILVRLKVIFPSTVRSRGRYEQVNPVPHESKGGGKDEEGGTDAAVVVEVLDRMHAQPRERLDVRVTVVERVHVFVQSLDADEPDMIFVTSSTSSASVKKILARVKLSRGNVQSVFFPRCNSVEKAPRGQRCKNYPRVVNK